MCLAPDTPKLPPSPPPPARADEENKAGVLQAIDQIKKRKGSNATFLTGGLGDSTFGDNVAVKTLTGA